MLLIATISQSQLIAQSCRQMYQGQPFETKKTDWALSFSEKHPIVKAEYEALKSGGAPALSQMNNPSTSKKILYSAIEVKTPNGNPTEAKVQLFTWLLAGFSRLRKLLKKVGNGNPTVEPTLPLLGWTVIGGEWQLYVAIGEGNKEEDGILILGPIRSCHCTTAGYADAFKLLQLIERVKDWARTVYWPWYKEIIVEPLKLLKGLPVSNEERVERAIDEAEKEDDDHLRT